LTQTDSGLGRAERFGSAVQAPGEAIHEPMRKQIQDEFTKLAISRQRKYQMRMKRDKRCTECGEPTVQGSRCLKHLVKARERQRRKHGLKRRYHNTLSYKLERAA
jgi:hypothetical protein